MLYNNVIKTVSCRAGIVVRDCCDRVTPYSFLVSLSLAFKNYYTNDGFRYSVWELLKEVLRKLSCFFF
jgi:hypothetical protein